MRYSDEPTSSPVGEQEEITVVGRAEGNLLLDARQSIDGGLPIAFEDRVIGFSEGNLHLGIAQPRRHVVGIEVAMGFEVRAIIGGNTHERQVRRLVSAVHNENVGVARRRAAFPQNEVGKSSEGIYPESNIFWARCHGALKIALHTSIITWPRISRENEDLLGWLA